MFKHYLTYSFAQRFHAAVYALELGHPFHESLVSSAESLLYHFERAIRAGGGGTGPQPTETRPASRASESKPASRASENKKDELKFLCVALFCLRDAKETMDKARATTASLDGTRFFEAESIWKILHQRLEQLCLDASKAENGQLRMLG